MQAYIWLGIQISGTFLLRHRFKGGHLQALSTAVPSNCGVHFFRHQLRQERLRLCSCSFGSNLCRATSRLRKNTRMHAGNLYMGALDFELWTFVTGPTENPSAPLGWSWGAVEFYEAAETTDRMNSCTKMLRESARWARQTPRTGH